MAFARADQQNRRGCRQLSIVQCSFLTRVEWRNGVDHDEGMEEGLQPVVLMVFVWVIESIGNGRRLWLDISALSVTCRSRISGHRSGDGLSEALEAFWGSPASRKRRSERRNSRIDRSPQVETTWSTNIQLAPWKTRFGRLHRWHRASDRTRGRL